MFDSFAQWMSINHNTPMGILYQILMAVFGSILLIGGTLFAAGAFANYSKNGEATTT